MQSVWQHNRGLDTCNARSFQNSASESQAGCAAMGDEQMTSETGYVYEKLRICNNVTLPEWLTGSPATQ